MMMLVGIASGVQAQMSERDRVLRVLGSSYARVDDTENALFEVDRFHIIRAEFDERKRLIELAVEPKYFLEGDHADWGEPDGFANFSHAEFAALSAKLKRIKALGKITKAVNTVAVVTNMTAWFTEYYQNASMTWGEVVDLRKGDNPVSEIRWFRFKYGANAERPRKQSAGPKLDLPHRSVPPIAPEVNK